MNRVGDCFFDQLELSGHAHRPSDLDLVAGLGVRVLRYPVLWERTRPDPSSPPDWAWADERFNRLRELGIRPIAGLVHHGSGPRHTDLLNPSFAPELAEHGRAVAERYPWIDAYTPVNEPLTTARFSGLYGLWWPHRRDDGAFVRALLHECKATVLTMRAVREVNPRAALVQTEDLSKVFSTEEMAYQAEFDNARRWLTFDLLCGMVRPGHRMWKYLLWAGASQEELDWFCENPCPPDILGANYYVTSERFLDERVHLYPPHTHGKNGRQAYVDTEAVRVRSAGMAGPDALLAEMWERYHLPMAVTEAHLACTREEQARWLAFVWNRASGLREQGMDVRAVTVWSLFGAYNWDCLLTHEKGNYEPGAFDLRAPQPRPTALARVVRDLANGHEPSLPVLQAPGWWERSSRLIFGFSVEETAEQRPPTLPAAARRRTRPPAPLLILGATGTLGSAFARICDVRGLAYRLTSRAEVEICDRASVRRAFDELKPWAVINAAGYVRVDDAEREDERGRCIGANAVGPELLARECAERGVGLLTFSSDLVFDGGKRAPYVESDPVSPLNVYGQSKADSETGVLSAMPGALVVRTSAFFGPWDHYNFVTAVLRALGQGGPFTAASDSHVSPTYVPDLVNTALDLLIDGESGIWHLANTGDVTWAEFARKAAAMSGFDPDMVSERPTAELFPAPRPLYSVLGSERADIMPSLEDALERYLRDCETGPFTGCAPALPPEDNTYNPLADIRQPSAHC